MKAARYESQRQGRISFYMVWKTRSYHLSGADNTKCVNRSLPAKKELLLDLPQLYLPTTSYSPNTENRE